MRLHQYTEGMLRRAKVAGEIQAWSHLDTDVWYIVPTVGRTIETTSYDLSAFILLLEDKGLSPLYRSDEDA
jgi:hypothetical protein